MPKSKLPQSQTLEVPKTISVKIVDGILVCAASRNSDLAILFKHFQGSMNDPNALSALKALAAAHGYSIEVEEE